VAQGEGTELKPQHSQKKKIRLFFLLQEKKKKSDFFSLNTQKALNSIQMIIII
jgi:hypothetical protein